MSRRSWPRGSPRIAGSPPAALGRSRLAAAAAPWGWLLLRLGLRLGLRFCSGAAGGSGVAVSAGSCWTWGCAGSSRAWTGSPLWARQLGRRAPARAHRLARRRRLELARGSLDHQWHHAGDEREAAGRQREPILPGRAGHDDDRGAPDGPPQPADRSPRPPPRAEVRAAARQDTPLAVADLDETPRPAVKGLAEDLELVLHHPCLLHRPRTFLRDSRGLIGVCIAR